MSPGHLSRIGSGRRVSLEEMVLRLHQLGVTPERFFADALGPDLETMLAAVAKEDRTVRDIRRLGPKLSTLAAEPMRADPRQASEWLALPELADRLRFLEDPGCHGREFLQQGRQGLEEEVDVDPAGVSRLAAELLLRVVPKAPVADRPAIYCQLVATFAFAKVRAGQSAAAAAALPVALAMTRHHPQLEPERGLTYRRMARVLAAAGEDTGAFEALAEAAAIYGRLGDGARFGRTLLFRGVLLEDRKRPRQALECLSNALSLLPERPAVWRASARRALGGAYRQLGDLRRAERQLQDSERLLRFVEGYERAILVREQGRLARQQGDCREAVFRWREAYELLYGLNPRLAAVALADLGCLLLEGGQEDEARRLFRGASSLLEPLRSEPVAADSLLDLIRGASPGRAGKQLLHKLASRLRRTLSPPAAERPDGAASACADASRRGGSRGEM